MTKSSLIAQAMVILAEVIRQIDKVQQILSKIPLKKVLIFELKFAFFSLNAETFRIKA